MATPAYALTPPANTITHTGARCQAQSRSTKIEIAHTNSTVATTDDTRLIASLALGFPWQNGCLQQIAADREIVPQDDILR
jgi:hypothetical protein